MKRQIRVILGMLLFFIVCSCSTVFASNAGLYDEYGILSKEQKDQLQTQLDLLNEVYPFEAVILISPDVNMDERKYAAQFMQKHDIGYGSEKDGAILFHQPDSRDIAIVFRGSLQYAFGEEIQDRILDDCIEKLQEDDFAGAYEVVLHDLENGMKRVSAGKKIRPVDMRGGLLGFVWKDLLLSFLIMAIPTFVMTMIQRAKMHMIAPQPNADSYIPEDGFILSKHTDNFVRSNTIRSAKPKDNGGGKGSSGSFSSGGESFSGSSRKY